MATITVAVGTGTQYQVGGAGNVYFFNGSQPASFTFPWVADGVLRLEQSGSSNDGHPLIFSTSNSVTLSLFKAGVISSGVTYYLDGSSNESDYTNTTTFNAATTRYIEITPTAATDFYFGCWIHGISMGGLIDITQNTWGALSWGNGNWNAQNNIDLSLTGFSITASLGDLAYAAAEDGWGRQAWGDDDWGTDSLTFIPTGLSMTGSVGTVAAASESGWGRATWGNEPWGDSNSPTVSVSGFAITGSLGTLPYAGSIEGWGRDEWGTGNWGENTTTVILDGFEMTTGLGLEGWGRSTWGNDAWGEQSTVNIEIGQSLTGFAITGSLGTPTLNYDFELTLTESLLGTLSLGSLSINNGADHTQGLGGIAATMSLGTLTITDIVQGLTGLSITGTVGTPAAGIVQSVDLTGFGITASQGSLGSFPDLAVGLSGFAITASLGSFTITDMQVGISGFEMSGTLGSAGMSPLHYKDVDITGYTAYTDIEHSA